MADATKIDRLYAAEIAAVNATADLLDTASGRNPHVAEPFRSILNSATPRVPAIPEWRGTKIRTDFIYPPIPDRRFDWCAVTDDYDGAPDAGHQPMGYGRSEQEAIADLIEQLEDEAE